MPLSEFCVSLLLLKIFISVFIIRFKLKVGVAFTRRCFAAPPPFLFLLYALETVEITEKTELMEKEANFHSQMINSSLQNILI